MTLGQALLTFTIAAGLLTVTPGLDTALVLRTAAVEGRKKAMLAGAGICTACLLWGLAAAIGLGALLNASRTAYQILRLAGAGYLIVLGCQLVVRRGHGVSPLASDRTPSARASSRQHACGWFARGFLTNILNPKVGLFYMTFLPQFVPPDVPVTLFTIGLATIHATEGILWFMLLTSATEYFAAGLRRPNVAKTVDRLTGAMLIAFGIRVAVEARR